MTIAQGCCGAVASSARLVWLRSASRLRTLVVKRRFPSRRRASASRAGITGDIMCPLITRMPPVPATKGFGGGKSPAPTRRELRRSVLGFALGHVGQQRAGAALVLVLG